MSSIGKKWFQSKTIWGILTSLFGNIDPIFDWLYTVVPPEYQGLVPVLAELLKWGGGFLGLYGRIQAEQPIELSSKA